MKNLIIILVVLLCGKAEAQKKSNLFSSIEFLKKTGVSVFYNRTLSKSRVGLGAGVQVVNFKGKDDYSALADFRYYYTKGKFTLIPNIQAGKNFTSFGRILNPAMPTIESTGKGGFHSNYSLGYSYKMLKNGGGPYINSGVRFISYNYFTQGIKFDTKVFADFLFSIGLRF